MDSELDSDWKKKVGFPINYDSSQSSEDDFDTEDVVMRHPRQSSRYILTDGGDGAVADELGSTPPRSRIREKERRRCVQCMTLFGCNVASQTKANLTLDLPTISKTELGMLGVQKTVRENIDTIDHPYTVEMSSPDPRLKKRASLKLIRSKERDWKQDMGQREPKADSLPSPNPLAAVPTLVLQPLVESCSRFMSLSSRPKCRESSEPSEGGADAEVARRSDLEVPASRVNFHQTFSMLINMGNVDKCCRRTISREEQVWQNELKDLIWLELQAKLAGRTLTQQDAYLCTQRNIVPKLIKNIFDYRFVNRNPCRGQASRLCAIQGSCEDVAAGEEHLDAKPDSEELHEEDHDDNGEKMFGCLSFDCQRCSEGVGRAMREVGTLLDSFYNAVELYPSTKAMTQDHPLIATQLFKNRIKAMCLWFNTALHMRLKIVSVRRMLRSLRLRDNTRLRSRSHRAQRASLDSDITRQSSESHRQCQVRFNVSNNPTDSSNSDSSSQSEHNKEDSSRDNSAKVRDDDEADSGIESVKCNGQITPEIVISDSRYGTADSSWSVEGDPECPSAATSDAFELGPLDEVAHLRLLDRCSVSLYREYHCEILKTQGVRRCMMFIYKMRKNILQKVYLTLEKPDVVKSETFDENDPVEVFEDSKDHDEKTQSMLDEDELKTKELRRFGWWSAECTAMRLPSYRAHFLLLSSICMEAVHDYLAFRLETRPDHPSCLTVKQLIHELKEGLDISTEMRCEFMRNVEAALGGRGAGEGRGEGQGEGQGEGAAAGQLRLLLHTYDTTVEAVLKQYLSYVRTMSLTEHMSRARLQHEWAFTARLARRVQCAALLAPLTFSDIACNQLNRILKQYEEKFEQLKNFEDGDRTDPDRHAIYAICRLAQRIYACERESTLHAAQWARALAARLARAPPPAYLQQREDIFNSLMAIRDVIVAQSEYILEKSGQPPSEELPRDVTEGVVTRVRELLLQVFKLGFELHKELYKFAQAPFKLLDEKVAKRQRPASLQPMPPPTIEYRRKRPETMIIHESFNPMIHKELHRFANESSNRAAPSLGPRRSVHSPPKGRPKFIRSESIGEDYETSVFDDKLFENLNNFGDGQVQSSIELLLSGQPPAGGAAVAGAARAGAAGGDSAEPAAERAWAGRSARAVVQYARCWMHFVVERCDRGRGRRPRWASQGLEFLMLACDPCNTKHLTDEEFEELKQLMDGCISHVIGSRPAAPRAADAAAAAGPHHQHHQHQHQQRHRLHSPHSNSSAGKEVPTPPTPPSEPEPLLCFNGIESIGHKRRVLEAIEAVDRDRDATLRKAKSVGRVVGAATTSYEPKLRQLTFKWQRGLKIGAGTFGKVYTVVNTESGQLLAMKELQVGAGAGDRRALQRAANELQVLEGVAHPHLVRYYGCELHREEMLLFMELCVEGSLEALVGTSGALAEPATRRYTKQLLSAVLELHARAIVHRDIKSGNIFLTNEGNCLKLGDFGCAVKIRANTTAPGELQGFVGTQSYMAPEVFMKSSGHGRAADIWSVGCVVTEMASGKRPFSEYDSNYQIMFVVGMGGRPHIPSTLSEEGQQFCLSCLTHDPDLRPKAEELSLHHFLLVNSDDDCQCQPAFLIT